MPSNASPAVTDNEAPIYRGPLRITEAWAGNDADAFADAFTEDGAMILPNDVYLTSREQIRAFMTAAFSGPYRGTRVFGEPLKVRRLSDTVVVLTTRGGVLQPGEETVSDDGAIRATWVLTKQDGDWLIASYQNTPING